MKTSLTHIAAKALPALSGSSLTYKPEKNVFLTLGYTSAAGNTYYRAIRISKRLAIYYHIGEGYAYTFLNGITLFCWDGNKKTHFPTWDNSQKMFICDEYESANGNRYYCGVRFCNRIVIVEKVGIVVLLTCCLHR